MNCHNERKASAAVVIAAVLSLAFGNSALGQASGEPSENPTNPSAGQASSAASTPTAKQPPLTVQSLIGDAVGDPGSPQYQDVADAVTRALNGDLVQAKTFLESAVKKNPNLPPVPVLVARILFAANQVPAARAELEKAVRDFPNDPEPYTLFAQLALRERQVTDAELLLQKAMKLNEAYKDNAKRKRNFDINIAGGLAVVAESREQWDTAIAQMKNLLQLDEDNVAAHQRLGVYLFRKGKGEEQAAKDAYAEFQAATKFDPKVNAEITMGELYQQTGEPEKAKKWIDYAVQLQPSDAKVQLAAANLSIQANRLDDAQKFADAAIKIDPDAPEAKMMRAGIARLSGDLSKAESLLEQLHLQFPSNVPAANLLAQVLVDQEDSKKKNRGLELAQMNLQAQTEGNQTNRDLLATYGWALFRNGQLNQAQNAIAKVAQTGQVGPDYAYFVAKVLLEPNGKFPEAVQLLEAAMKSPQPFAYRIAASALMNELKSKPAPAATPTGTTVPPIIPEVSPSTTPTPLPGTTPGAP